MIPIAHLLLPKFVDIPPPSVQVFPQSVFQIRIQFFSPSPLVRSPSPTMRLLDLLVAIMASIVLATVPLTTGTHPSVVDNNYIVVMKKGVDLAKIQAHYTSLKATSGKLTGGMRGFVKHFQVHTFNAYHIECDDKMLEDIRANDLVDYIAQDTWMTVQTPIPRETILGFPSLRSRDDNQTVPWGLGRISHRLPGIAAYVDVSVPRTRAYMLDTGIRLTHKEFGGRAIWGKTIMDGAPDDDDEGHGTATAAIVGGDTVGVDNSTLLIAVKVLGKDGGYTTSTIDGIGWAVDDALKANAISRSVINMSLGGPFSNATNDAVDAAVAAGMTVVVAAGNSNDDSCDHSPSSASSAITVAAIDQQDRRSSYSSWGGCVNIFAPGDGIHTASFNGDDTYTSASGTSVASPHVAGIVTLLKARENLQTPKEVWDRISQLGTRDRVQDAHDSANLIAFNGNPAEIEDNN
ncbi:peptidase S8/S53 domain-containing protein [Biscogniauxia sp. FL1348]|nr:peptidase S8/S53 domain-containing protein [Biscogniauxia sp. FL1348]